VVSVDVSTASRATIGGMAGNNSCGGRSLRYGTMRDNTLSMDAALADGTLLHFGRSAARPGAVNSPESGLALFRDMLGPANARRPRSRNDFQSPAPCGRLQSRCAGAAQYAEHGASPGLLRERWPSPPGRTETSPSSATRCSVFLFRQLL
jgi:hypothetical protein